MSWRTKLRALFHREKLDADMAEEMRAHLELQTERNVAAGMSPAEARFAAQRQFGGIEQVKEFAREQRSWVWLEHFLQDLRFAARGLRKNPGFTVVAVLTLAFGIGVNTAMFTALQSVLMRDLPYPESERLVEVFRASPQSQRWPHAPANFLDQQSHNTVFERMAAFTGKAFNLAESGQPAERVRGMQATAEIFPLLGVQPFQGRWFTAEEDRPGKNDVVVLSHAFWLRRFAGDPNVVGRTLRLDGETATVIGVMPAEFEDMALFGRIEMWQPIAFSDAERANRGGNYLKSIARLKPGVSLAQAQTAMDILAAAQAQAFRESNAGIGLRLVPLAKIMDPRGRLVLWLVMALAGSVLLIACANLANLQFARTARRTQEFAIRGALGASRGRLLRQLLTESFLIAVVGGLIGLMLAKWTNAIVGGLETASGDLAIFKLTLNLRVFGFALVASVISGLAFGLMPAWLASRTDVNQVLKQGARGTAGNRSRHRIQHALIVAEVALALVLLASAGLVVRGLNRFVGQEPGWQINGLTVGYLNLSAGKYRGAEAQHTFAERLREKLAALPGVERAAVSWCLPLSSFDTMGNFKVEGHTWPEGREPIRFVNGVTPGYFEVLRMRLVAGRDFTAADVRGAKRTVIINETTARVFWPKESAIGKHLDGEEVVGVVNDVGFATDPSEPETRLQTYRPLAQAPRISLAVALRGHVTAETLRRAVAELDADLPVNEPGPASAKVERFANTLAVAGWLLSGFAVLGLLLACIGIYGVIAGFVVQRTNEIGIRMALGAQVRDVLQLVIGKGLQLALLGTAIGLAGAVGVARVTMSVAPGFGANDPLAIGGVAALLVTVAVLACWLPARRAAKIDPALALRSE